MNNQTKGHIATAQSPESCPVTQAMKLIGGKWKPIILHSIMIGVNRFGEMQRAIDGISKQMLTKELRQLEADGLIRRTVYPVVPPKVEYALTGQGALAIPAIQALAEYGRELKTRVASHDLLTTGFSEK